MSLNPSKKWCRRVALSLGLCCLLPAASRAEDKELIKPSTGGPAAPAPTPMSAEEMKAAGERATAAAAKLGWRLGCQAYTFRNRSFYGAVDQVNELGLHFIEAYPGQMIDADKNIKMGPELTPEQRAAVKKKLADSNVKLINYGVTAIPKDPAAAKTFFDFAKDMGLETIVTEADPETLKAIAPLADEYKINVALHDHSKQVKSRYWSPELVLEAVGSLSKRFGSCADVGHWQRSGLDPVEALKKLEGRIIEAHFKDLNKRGEQGAVDVPWGTGTGNAMGMLEELKRQNAKISFSIEYENLNKDLVQNVAHSIAWYATACEQLASKSADASK